MSRLIPFGVAAFIVGLAGMSSLLAQQDIVVTLPRYEAVLKELGVTEEERDKLKAFGDELQREGERIRTAELPNTQKMSPEERGKFFAAQRRTLNDKYLPKLKEILRPEQFERLMQISYQVQRTSVYENPAVIKTLELTKEQQEKLAAVNKEYRAKIQDHWRGLVFGGPPSQRPPQYSQLLEEQNAEILKVVTPEQAEKLTQLRGKPVDLATLDRGRPGPQLFTPPATTNRQDSLETKFDQSVIDYVNGTLLREQDTNGDGSIDKSEWVKGKWSMANPPENSDLNKDGKLSREELCIRISKSRGIPIKGEQPQPLPDSSK